MRLVSFRRLCGMFMVLFTFAGHAQDLFDYENSKTYANYLFESGRYEESVQEYDRVVFMRPSDTTAWYRLIRSYQYLGQYDLSVSYANRAETKLNIGNPTLGKMKMYSLLYSEEFTQVRQQLPGYDLTADDRIFLETMSYSLNREWEEGAKISGISTDHYLVQQAHTINLDALNQKHKSPLLAGVLSGVLPGSGKFYTGRWKDGLFSLLLCASSGWQAYRIISQKGIQNPGAWFFGGMSAGFYVGNVYGSVKSAQGYNENEQEKYEKRSIDLLDIYYGK